MARWMVFAVDRAGTPWDVLSHDEPQEVLRFLREAREAHPFKTSGRVYGCYDEENPERGDAEMRLEELVAEAGEGEPC